MRLPASESARRPGPLPAFAAVPAVLALASSSAKLPSAVGDHSSSQNVEEASHAAESSRDGACPSCVSLCGNAPRDQRRQAETPNPKPETRAREPEPNERTSKNSSPASLRCSSSRRASAAAPSGEIRLCASERHVSERLCASASAMWPTPSRARRAPSRDASGPPPTERRSSGDRGELARGSDGWRGGGSFGGRSSAGGRVRRAVISRNGAASERGDGRALAAAAARLVVNVVAREHERAQALVDADGVGDARRAVVAERVLAEVERAEPVVHEEHLADLRRAVDREPAGGGRRVVVAVARRGYHGVAPRRIRTRAFDELEWRTHVRDHRREDGVERKGGWSSNAHRQLTNYADRLMLRLGASSATPRRHPRILSR